MNCCLSAFPQCLRRGALRYPLTTHPPATGFGRFNMLCFDSITIHRRSHIMSHVTSHEQGPSALGPTSVQRKMIIDSPIQARPQTSLSLSLSLSIYIYTYMYVSLSLYMYVCIYIYIYLYTERLHMTCSVVSETAGFARLPRSSGRSASETDILYNPLL